VTLDSEGESGGWLNPQTSWNGAVWLAIDLNDCKCESLLFDANFEIIKMP
jgi:hypothetical protein